MNKVFADTSGWANFFVRTEPFYASAKNQMKRWYTENFRVFTSNYVLTELIALLTSPLRVERVKTIKIIESIKTADWIEVVHVDFSIDDEAWRLLKNRPDKTWSLVDCASMIIMEHFGIHEAFTADHHFEQAGFSITLKN